MFRFTVFEILLSEGRSVLRPTQRATGSERVKIISVKRNRIIFSKSNISKSRICLRQEFGQWPVMRASTGGVSSMPRGEHAISAIPDELCFLNYSQTCDSYNYCLLWTGLLLLTALLLKSEIIFNIRSIFICAVAVLIETLNKFSILFSNKWINKWESNEIEWENSSYKNWWNFCKNTS